MRTNKNTNDVGNWREYAVHDDDEIKGFFGKYRWLSNFYTSDVLFDGLLYQSSETAYQSAKVIRELREPFTDMDDCVSKKAWKTLPKEALIPHWDNNKYRIMDIIVFDKFSRNENLKQKLIDTKDKYLEESNHWSDTFWGVDYDSGLGENSLGKILMDVRRYFRTQ